MKVYVRQHEAYVRACIEAQQVNAALITYHEKRIEWLAHERLVHLLVFLFTLTSLMVFFIMAYITGDVWFYVITFILLIVSVFYCFHYFYLENTVQHWYKIGDELVNKRRTGDGS